jgi:hypothetical protein
MTRIRAPKTVLATSIAVAAVLVPAGTAGADEWPDVHCNWQAPKTYRLAKLLRSGLPIKASCDTATSVSPLLMFKFGTKQDRKWADLHNHGIPGIDSSRPVSAPLGQTVTARARLWKKVVKFVRRYPKTKFKVLLGVKEAGKPYYKSIDSGKVVTVIR